MTLRSHIPIAEKLAQKNKRESFSIEQFNQALYDIVKEYNIHPPVDSLGNRIHDRCFTPLSVAWILVSKLGIKFYRNSRVLLDRESDTIVSYRPDDIETLAFAEIAKQISDYGLAAPIICITDHFINPFPKYTNHSAQDYAELCCKRMDGDVNFYLAVDITKWLTPGERTSEIDSPQP